MILAMRKRKAFTLAELLIALAVLGVIATFTIPKVLGSQTDAKNRAICKEAAAMVTQAYQTWKIDHVPSATQSTVDDLMPLTNNLGIDTSTTIDSAYSGNPYACSAPNAQCYQLHSGAMIIFNKGIRFGGTNANNGILFIVDPDGIASNNKSVGFALRFNGKLDTYGTMGTINYADDTWPGGSSGTAGIPDPTWFTW
jgi:prepilin-type N-terminal cleavage/methylation domain-containing protein